MSETLEFGRDQTVQRLFADPWIGRLNAVDTVRATIRVANDFAREALSPAEHAALRVQAPSTFATTSDVTEYTFAITQAQLTLRKKAAADDELLDRVALFFSYASARISYLK